MSDPDTDQLIANAVAEFRAEILPRITTVGTEGARATVRKRKRQRRALILTVVLVIAIPAGLQIGFGLRHSRPLVGSTASPTSAPATTQATTTPSSPSPSLSHTSTAEGSWRALATMPFPADSTSGVWTGSELVIVSLIDTRAAAYNPTSDTWRALPDAPAYLGMEGRVRTFWTGQEVLVFGTINAAFDPRANRWRKLAQTIHGGPSVAVWTGTQVLMWGGGCCESNSDRGSAYDLATDTWQALPPGPLSARRTSGVWTGREMIVVGGFRVGAQYQAFADAAAYDPATRSWRTLPALPAPRQDASIVWTGSNVLVVGGRDATGAVYQDGLVYDPTANSWRGIAAMDAPRFDHMAVWTGTHLLIWGGSTTPQDPQTHRYSVPSHGLAYDPVSDRWSALPSSPLRGRTDALAIWTGTSMMIWGGVDVRQPNSIVDGAEYRP